MLTAAALPLRARGMAPVRVGLDAGPLAAPVGPAPAILFGASEAVRLVNGEGGVLGGRRLELVLTDNRLTPARGVANLKSLEAVPDLTALICGDFPPVAFAQLPHAHALALPLLSSWAAADQLAGNGRNPNYAFRIAAADSAAAPSLLGEACDRDHRRIGLMLPASIWGHSFLDAVEAWCQAHGEAGVKLVGTTWHLHESSGSLHEGYLGLLAEGAESVILVAGPTDAAVLVRHLAEDSAANRRPLLSHCGPSGADFPALCGLSALAEVDLTVVQAFSFDRPRNREARMLAERARSHFRIDDPLRIPSAAGIGTTYDLVRLLARAIDAAGSTERTGIRSALERLGAHEGVVKRYAPAFTADQHDGLQAADLILSRYLPDGRLVPLPRS
jgi:branched-chain amino acid transport system substrate-binding protein